MHASMKIRARRCRRCTLLVGGLLSATAATVIALPR